MAQSESIATAVDNSNWNGFLADDGTVKLPNAVTIAT